MFLSLSSDGDAPLLFASDLSAVDDDDASASNVSTDGLTDELTSACTSLSVSFAFASTGINLIASSDFLIKSNIVSAMVHDNLILD